MSTLIHGNPPLSTGFAVGFAVKGERKNPAYERVSEELYVKKNEPKSLLVAARFIFTYHQGFTPPTLPAHLDEEPTDTLQWKRGSPFHLR